MVVGASISLVLVTGVMADGQLPNIEPLVLADNNSAPAAGKTHVRFVHALSDAAAVDIAVANGGPILFSNVPFKGIGDYLPVEAGTYDLEACIAGTDTVALSVPGVMLNSLLFSSPRVALPLSRTTPLPLWGARGRKMPT